MKAVAKRLLRLEAHFGSMVDAARAAGVPSGAEVIAQNLADLGIVREPNESLAEMTARAMGITIPELKCELRCRKGSQTRGPIWIDCRRAFGGRGDL